MSVRAQGNFANLGFESANLSPIPSGEFGGPVSSLNAVPSWIAFLGTNQATQVYGANINPSDAGQVKALTITALAGPNTTDYFDSFVFSSLPIPEPNAPGLLALGGLLLSLRCRRR